MPKVDSLFAQRKPLGEICKVPDRIISVYSLEKHVWADGNSAEARKDRRPELQTIEEFRIDPVRPFLDDVLRNLAAPYSPARRDQPIGQRQFGRLQPPIGQNSAARDAEFHAQLSTTICMRPSTSKTAVGPIITFRP